MKKILFICPIYNSYPQIISSLICQTNPNWELLLIHDGPNSTGLLDIINKYNDSRVRYIELKERINDYGHSLRQYALREIKHKNIKTNCDYVVITNPDNYYIPIFIDEMLKPFKNKKIVATYCSKFVHGYISAQEDGDYRFGTISTKLELGYIDCGGVVIRKKEACEIGWNSLEIYSDWTYFKDLIEAFGEDKWERVMGCLFIHN